MKRKIIITLFVIFVMALSACRSGTEKTNTAESNSSDISDENAYPAPGSSSLDGAYPLEEKQPVGESAYPITEADREILMKNWSLVTLAENGTIQEVQPQTLQLDTNGSYSLSSEKDSESGTWTAKLSENESSLTLYPEPGEPLTFVIIELNETLLHLRSWQGNTQIDRMYLSVE